jgi:hypothetical protein
MVGIREVAGFRVGARVPPRLSQAHPDLLVSMRYICCGAVNTRIHMMLREDEKRVSRIRGYVRGAFGNIQ